MSDNKALIAEARARAHRIIDANGGYMTSVPGDDHLLLRLADALVQADADTQRLREADGSDARCWRTLWEMVEGGAQHDPTIVELRRIIAVLDEARHRAGGDRTCPCGAPLVCNGITVRSHWIGGICDECEAQAFQKAARVGAGDDHDR